jgi:hypothetical protein
MILIDKRGHMVSDTSEKELHAFAHRLGLLPSWYQDKKRPHYDLTTTRAINRAILLGACMVSSRELVRRAWWQVDAEVKE